MQTDVRTALLGARPHTDTVHRLEDALCALDARIARLSIALRVPLTTEADVERALQHRAAPVAVERRQGPNPDYAGPERRVAHHHAELRALLVMRWELCRQLAGSVGAPAVRHLLHAACGRLQREGFSAEAQGALLHSLAD